MKTTQCHSPHSWIFRARYCKCALFSNKQRTTARTHGGGSTPTSLAQSRLFFSKQEAVDICPWYFQNTLFTRKTQLLFQSVTFFPAVPTVANYECCKQDRNQIPNYSELIQKRVAIVGEKKKKSEVAAYCKAMLESFNPKQYWRKDFWNSMGNIWLKLQNPYLYIISC